MTEAEDNMVMEEIEELEWAAFSFGDDGPAPDPNSIATLKHLYELHKLRDWNIYADVCWESDFYLDANLRARLQEMQ